MSLIKLIFVCLIPLLLCNVVNAQDSDLERFLPVDDIPGWWPDSEIAAYEGDDLFFLINGGADLYLEYGFVQVISRSFKNAEGNYLKAEIYEMSDEGAAYGIYSLFRTGEKALESGIYANVKENYARFISERYFVMIMLDESSPEGVKAMLRFTLFILQSMPQSDVKPEILNMLPDEGFISGHVKYFRGHLGLSNIYSFNTSDIFHFQEGVYGNYGTYSIFILQYKEEEVLKEIVKKLPDNLMNNKRFSDLEMYEEGFRLRDNRDQTIVMEVYQQYLLIFMGEDAVLQPELFERIREGESDDLLEVYF